MGASILVVDDDPELQKTYGLLLNADGYAVATAGSGEEALRRLDRRAFDVLVSDIKLPGLTGLDVLERARTLHPALAVILITGYATIETAVEALRRGASDFLRKPFRVDELRQSVERALSLRSPAEPPGATRATAPRPTPSSLIGDSPALRAVREQIARCAATPSTVLITGESGVGKELVANAIHAASPRRDRPFVAVNCGAIPEALMESELFGHVRGAFTTALQANPGLFAAAASGTLFLDEVGELPPALQVKLLRVLEDRQVWPVGATRPVPVDVRLVASTNRDLGREVAAGRFREDLFYRLNVVHVALPPLRERRGDIPALVEHLVRRLNAKLDTAFAGVDRAALQLLMDQPWRGNVRELENLLECAMVLGVGPTLSVQHLAAGLTIPGEPVARGLRDAVRRFERQYVLDVLAAAGHDKREAARILEISLASLYRKLESP
jgi:DNA-binding NtrC family response regulator